MATEATGIPRKQKAKEPKLIVWKDAYKVGVAKLDNQHMKIIDTINTIYDYQQNKAVSRCLDGILKDLLMYTKTHFADEERLLRQVNYPEFQEHKKHHDSMAQQIQAIREEYLHSHENLSGDVIDFFKIWWLNHIQINDRDCAKYLKRPTVRDQSAWLAVTGEYFGQRQCGEQSMM